MMESSFFSIIFHFFFLVFFGTGSYQPSTAVPVLPPAQLDELQTPGETSDDTFEGEKILQGKFDLGDYHGATVDGVFVDINPLYNGDDSTKAASEIELQWADKMVEVKGDLYIHYCGYDEQCLSDGKIPYLKNVEYIKALE